MSCWPINILQIRTLSVCLVKAGSIIAGAKASKVASGCFKEVTCFSTFLIALCPVGASSRESIHMRTFLLRVSLYFQSHENWYFTGMLASRNAYYLATVKNNTAIFACERVTKERQTFRSCPSWLLESLRAYLERL